MSKYQYFLIFKNTNLNTYVIESGPFYLPQVFKSISGVDVLEDSNPALLIDLSWADIQNYGFWKASSLEKPIINCEQKLIEEYNLDEENKLVIISYRVENLSQEESLNKKQSFIRNLKPTRDRYLSMTDFTQLPDAPLSEESKLEFSIFRKKLRELFDTQDLYSIQWPQIPTSAPNVEIPSFPNIPACN